MVCAAGRATAIEICGVCRKTQKRKIARRKIKSPRSEIISTAGIYSFRESRLSFRLAQK
jgi:hypothetical protein